MKKLFSAVILASSLAFLTACNASMAAQIGDTKISASDVQSQMRSYDMLLMCDLIGGLLGLLQHILRPPQGPCMLE